MKSIDFAVSENIVENTKVSATFVQELQEAFSMSPTQTDMRFKQSSKGELIISVTFAYDTGMKQHLEGAGDSDLITAINFCMAKITKLLDDYKAEEHEVDTAKDGENLVMELFKQHINSPIYGYVEKWKIQCKLPPKTKRFCPLKTFNNAPLKSLDRWGYYYFRFFSV